MTPGVREAFVCGSVKPGASCLIISHAQKASSEAHTQSCNSYTQEIRKLMSYAYRVEANGILFEQVT